MSIGTTRKLFIDSRYKTAGTDADFVIELPVDVNCTRTSSFFVASCSFANTFQIITPYNNKLYYFLIDMQGIIHPPIVLYVTTIAPGAYTPETLAPLLQQGFGAGCTAVTWDATTGKYEIDFVNKFDQTPQYILPSYNEIDTIYQQLGALVSFQGPYTPGDKFQSVNTLLNFPTSLPLDLPYPSGHTTFHSGIVDLAPVREVYLHSSLANNRTLHVNGARDCIARIPIEVDFGQIVSYRYLGPTDAISCSDAHFRSISFQMRDYAGNILPTGSFVVIELAFLDTDPYAM